MFNYPRVRIISLPERTDRRAQMRRGLRHFRTEPTFFDAIRPDDKGRFANIGFHGSYLSHLAVLKEGGPVLILEDDCAFYPGANDFHASEFDVFYGSHCSDADEIIGAHCMGFSAKAADLAASYLSGLLDGSIGPDPRALREGVCDPAILPPIDGAYVWFRRAHPELTTWFHEVSYQRSSRSDCTPGRLDSIPVVRQILGISRALVG